MKKILLINVIIFIYIFPFSCNKNGNKTDLFSDISRFIKFDANEDYAVIITQDTDCQSCLWKYSEKNILTTKKYFGLFLINVDKKFSSVLTKINPEIDWIEITDESLYAKLFRMTNRKGPYVVHIENNVVSKIE
jgi:hypothetical protein